VYHIILIPAAVLTPLQRYLNAVLSLLQRYVDRVQACIQISTEASLTEMIAPALLVMVSPVATGDLTLFRDILTAFKRNSNLFLAIGSHQSLTPFQRHFNAD